MGFGWQTSARAVRIAVACLFACLVVLAVAGCGGGSGNQSASTAPTGAKFDPPEKVLMPEVPKKGPQIDTSHVSDGYVVIRCESNSRLKFQVSKGDMTYNHDLPNDGTPTVYPINMGDGSYLMRIMKNTSGNDYVEIDSAEGNVTLTSEFAPFVIPNQFCNYNAKSKCVKKARELTADSSTEGDAVCAVCNYVVDNITYDTPKAQELTTVSGYVPDPDETLETGKGICFDYASLGGAMLRSLGFPAKIVTGYVSPGDLYHAWLLVYVDGSWQSCEFSVNPETWSRVDLTFAASGSTEFTGDGASYTERYIY